MEVWTENANNNILAESNIKYNAGHLQRGDVDVDLLPLRSQNLSGFLKGFHSVSLLNIFEILFIVPCSHRILAALPLKW